MTDAEARSMWERMLHDDDLGKDNDGPRGFRRVAVKVRDILTQYEEISRSQVARREEKLGKKATEEDLAKRLRMVFSGMQKSGEGLGEFEDLLGQTVRNMSGEGGSSMLDGVLTNSAIADLMLRVKGKKASDDDMEGAEEQEDVEEGAEKTAKAASSKETSTPQKARPPSDSKSSPSNSWFSEMQINKAERSFSLKIGRVRTQLSGTVVKMEEAIKEFAKDHKNYPQEVSSVTRRRAWLAAILEDSPTRLEGLLKEHKSKSAGAGKSEGASSRDMGAVARAGPCANFESLQHFGVLTAHCQLAKTCTSEEDLKQWETQMDPLLKVYQVLQTACKSAVADLFQARTQAQANEANMVKQKAKEEAERKRKLAAVGGSASKRGRKERSAQVLALLNGDIISQEANFQVPSAAEWPLDCDLSKPFLLTGQSWLEEEVKAKACLSVAIADFVDSFDASTLKVTDGRAQRRFADQDINTLVVNMGLRATKNDPRLELTFATGSAQLQQVVGVAVFGIAAGNVSKARFELQELGCMRLAARGTRTAVLVSAMDVAKHISTKENLEGGCDAVTLSAVESWANTCKAEDISEFIDAGFKPWHCTQGANDVLFLPSGYVTLHQILNNTDFIGFRLGAVSRYDLPALKHCVADHGKQNHTYIVQEEAIAVCEALPEFAPPPLPPPLHGGQEGEEKKVEADCDKDDKEAEKAEKAEADCDKDYKEEKEKEEPVENP